MKKLVFLSVKTCSNRMFASSRGYGESPLFSGLSVSRSSHVDSVGLVLAWVNVGFGRM